MDKEAKKNIKDAFRYCKTLPIETIKTGLGNLGMANNNTAEKTSPQQQVKNR
jgi:hypothetical protein